MLYCVLLYCYLVEYNGTFNIGGYYEVNCLSSLPRLHRHCTVTVYSIKGVAQLSLTGRSQHHITVLLVQYAHSTLETRYNALQYNANSVITRLQCWLPFRWELHPTTVSKLAVMRDQRYADHPHCVTRDGMQQLQRGLLCTCMSSVHLCRRGREE